LAGWLAGSIGRGGEDAIARSAEPATAVTHCAAHAGTVADRQPQDLGTPIVSRSHTDSFYLPQ